MLLQPSYLRLEIEAPEEPVHLERVKFTSRLGLVVFPQLDDLSPPDGRSEARALHYPSAALRVGRGPGGHGDVGGVFQVLQVTYCQEEESVIQYVAKSFMHFPNFYHVSTLRFQCILL